MLDPFTATAILKAHLLELYRGVTPRNSFADSDRQIVDCVPIEQQPGLRPPRRPGAQAGPDVPSSTAAAPAFRGDSRPSDGQPSGDITLNGSQENRGAHELPCQTGTIPMRRLTLERLATFRTLASFLAK
jgi:hypothetical protein